MLLRNDPITYRDVNTWAYRKGKLMYYSQSLKIWFVSGYKDLAEVKESLSTLPNQKILGG